MVTFQNNQILYILKNIDDKSGICEFNNSCDMSLNRANMSHQQKRIKVEAILQQNLFGIPLSYLAREYDVNVRTLTHWRDEILLGKIS